VGRRGRIYYKGRDKGKRVVGFRFFLVGKTGELGAWGLRGGSQEGGKIVPISQATQEDTAALRGGVEMEKMIRKKNSKENGGQWGYICQKTKNTVPSA